MEPFVAKLKKPVLIGLIGVGVVVALGGLYAIRGSIPTPAFMKATVPEATGTLAADVNRGVPREAYELPVQPVANFQGAAKILSIPWNATSALGLANGGARTPTIRWSAATPAARSRSSVRMTTPSSSRT